MPALVHPSALKLFDRFPSVVKSVIITFSASKTSMTEEALEKMVETQFGEDYVDQQDNGQE